MPWIVFSGALQYQEITRCTAWLWPHFLQPVPKLPTSIGLVLLLFILPATAAAAAMRFPFIPASVLPLCTAPASAAVAVWFIALATVVAAASFTAPASAAVAALW